MLKFCPATIFRSRQGTAFRNTSVLALVAPVAAGALQDVTLTQATGVQTIQTAQDFTGSGLEYSINSVAGVTINPANGVVSVDTANVLASTSIVVTATNSEGSAQSSFSLVVEAVAALTQATFDGVTADFTGATSAGFYADGSPWMNGDGSQISVTGFDTPSAPITRTTANGTVYNNMQSHGAMLNPGAAPSGATVAERQAVNDGLDPALGSGYIGQGYDAFVGVNNQAYDATTNIEPGATGQPIAITEGMIVKAISDVTGINNNARPAVNRLVPFTIVTEEPAAGEFRPGHAEPRRRTNVTVSDLLLDRLPNLDATGLAIPGFATLISPFRFVSWEHTYNALSRNFMPSADGSPVYGGNRDAYTEAMLATCYDTLTASEKEQIAVKLVQMAYDIASMVYQGAIWQDNGGHANGQKSILAYAARLTDDAYLINALTQTTTSYIFDTNQATASVFAEDRQVFLITQEDVDRSKEYAYTAGQIGLPEWSSDATRDDPVGVEERQNTLYVDTADATTPDLDRQDYRYIVAGVNVPAKIALEAIGAKTLFANDDWFDYYDRHMEARIVFDGEVNDSVSNPVSSWVIDAHEADRPSFGGAISYAITPTAFEPYDPGTGTINACVIKSQGKVVGYITDGGTVVTSEGFSMPESATPGTYSGILDSGQPFSITISEGEATVVPGPVVRPKSFMFLEQSQGTFLFSNTAAYQQIPHDDIPAENVIVYTDNDVDRVNGDIVRTVVTQTTVDAGQVNPWVSTLSGFLHHLVPGEIAHLFEATDAGTGMRGLMDDSDPDRRWGPFLAMVMAARAQGTEITNVNMSWMGNDAIYAKTWLETFAPFLFGCYADGTIFNLGDAHPTIPGAFVNNCLWDIFAPANEYGRGVFRKDITAFDFVGYPTFNDTGFNEPEWLNSSTTNAGATSARVNQIDYPAREQMAAVVAFAQSYGIEAHEFASSHIAVMGNSFTADADAATHPDPSTPEGTIAMGWARAVSIADRMGARIAGQRIAEPYIDIANAVVASDGSTVTLPVVLPNGGTLQNTNIVNGTAAPGTLPPHWQDAMSFELQRNGDAYTQRRDIYRTDAGAGYPDTHKGTVAFSGSSFVITPLQPVNNGDRLTFLMADASTIRAEPRDVEANTQGQVPLVTLPELIVPGALYPCPGLPVRPQPTPLVISGVTATPPPTGQSTASRSAGDDAYYTGPALPSGTVAITALIEGLDIPVGTGATEILEFTSTIFQAVLDDRATKRGLAISVQASDDSTQVFGATVSAPDGSLPTGPQDLLVSVSQDDGTGTARIQAQVNGSSIIAETTAATVGSGTFPTRPLEIFRSTSAMSFERARVFYGTHAQGYTATSDVSGLTAVHDLDAADANAPTGTLVKAGADDFTITT